MATPPPLTVGCEWLERSFGRSMMFFLTNQRWTTFPSRKQRTVEPRKSNVQSSTRADCCLFHRDSASQTRPNLNISHNLWGAHAPPPSRLP